MTEQLIFRFLSNKIYSKDDFYVTKSNKEAFVLVESWPKWLKRSLNIFGPSGSGKSHLVSIFEKKTSFVKIECSDLSDKIFMQFKLKESLIIENLDDNVPEKILYSLFNMASQDNKYILITSKKSLASFNFSLDDLQSRVNSSTIVEIKPPDDDLINVILSKNFSDRQINIDKKHIDYIIKRTDRSYEKISQFISNLDNYSLRKGQSVGIKIIKEVLKMTKV